MSQPTCLQPLCTHALLWNKLSTPSIEQTVSCFSCYRCSVVLCNVSVVIVVSVVIDVSVVIFVSAVVVNKVKYLIQI